MVAMYKFPHWHRANTHHGPATTHPGQAAEAHPGQANSHYPLPTPDFLLHIQLQQVNGDCNIAFEKTLMPGKHGCHLCILGSFATL